MDNMGHNFLVTESNYASSIDRINCFEPIVECPMVTIAATILAIKILISLWIFNSREFIISKK